MEAQINDYVKDQLADNNLADIAEYIDMLATMLKNFEVITELDVGKTDSAGNANATHTLSAIAFQKDGARLVVNADILSSLSAARNVSVNADFGANTLDVGDHAFKLPLGEFAVAGFHLALEEKFGITDLGAALQEMVDCKGLATNIGDVEAFGFTVASESQIENFCNDGLEKLPAQLDAQIRKLEFAELHMIGGEGSLQMASKSVNAMKGTWSSEFGIKGNGFSLPSIFEAIRM